MKKYFYFTPYKYPNPLKYEKWLEEKALEGFYPDKLNHFSSMRMNLEKRESKKYKYVVDLQAKFTDEYKSIYTDFGWEYVGRMSSMHIWRQEYSDIEPESFTDTDSLLKRNKRFVIAISAVFWAMALTILVLVVVFALELGEVMTITTDKVDVLVDRVMPITFLTIVDVFIGYSARKAKM